MSKILRWGLLSTARINQALIPPLQASRRNDLVAVASRRPEQAESYAETWGIPRAHGSYEALLADPDIDVIYIPLPNHLHAEWAIKAAQAGKHVLCEKPLALTVEAVDRMTVAAQRARTVLAEAFMYRHHPRTKQVKALVTGGAIGELHAVRGAFSFVLNRPDNIRTKPEMGGGGLWDVGCYPISFARYVIGAEPVEVYGRQVLGPSGVDISFSGSLRFPNDVLVQFDAAIRSHLRMEMEFVGSEGVLRIPLAFKPGERSHIILERGDSVETRTIHSNTLYSYEIEDMADAVLEDKPQGMHLSDSRANIATIVALLQSAREGRPVLT